VFSRVGRSQASSRLKRADRFHKGRLHLDVVETGLQIVARCASELVDAAGYQTFARLECESQEESIYDRQLPTIAKT
jgi:hypothetical protein